jgi:hypothetical protein
MEFKNKTNIKVLHVCCCFIYEFYKRSPNPDRDKWEEHPVEDNYCNMVSPEQAENLCECRPLEENWLHTEYVKEKFNYTLGSSISAFEKTHSLTPVEDPKVRQMDFEIFYECDPPIWTVPRIFVPNFPPHNQCKADKTWTEHEAVLTPELCYKDDQRLLKRVDNVTAACIILEKPNSLPPEITPLYNCNSNTLKPVQVDVSPKSRDQCSNLPIDITSDPPVKTAVVMKFRKNGADVLQVCCCFNYDLYGPGTGSTILKSPPRFGPLVIPRPYWRVTAQSNSCSMRNKKMAEDLCSCKKLGTQQKHIDYAHRTFPLVKEEVEKFAAANNMTVGTGTGPVIQTTEFDNDYGCLVSPAAG